MFSISAHIYNEFKTTFWSLLIAVLLLMPAIKLYTLPGIITIIVTAIMVYIMISSMNGINREGALPSVTYPGPPHLGLDGISLENRL